MKAERCKKIIMAFVLAAVIGVATSTPVVLATTAIEAVADEKDKTETKTVPDKAETQAFSDKAEKCKADSRSLSAENKNKISDAKTDDIIEKRILGYGIAIMIGSGFATMITCELIAWFEEHKEQ